MLNNCVIQQLCITHRSNRKFFDMYGISTVCPEILRTHGGESPFLSLNVKSILQNVNAVR